jgi:periplasmic mercuric ion binding protein
MKTAIALFTLTLALFVAPSVKGQSPTPSNSRYQEVKIMTSAVCEMCETTIENKMFKTKGVRTSSLDVPTKVLTVLYDTKHTSVETIRKAINDVGYDADDSPATAEAYEKLHACCKKDSH